KRKGRLRFGSTIPRASLQTIKSSFITQARTCSIAARGTSRQRESWAWALQILSRSIIAELPNKDCLTKMNQTSGISMSSNDGKVYAVNCDSGAKVWEAAVSGEVWTSPVVRNGVVFFGSADARLYAVDAETGGKRWAQEFGGRIYSTPFATEKQLYFGCGDGNVYSVDMTSGKLLWRASTGNGIDSSPAVSVETVLIGSEDFFFYALDANTGAVRWKYE